MVVRACRLLVTGDSPLAPIRLYINHLGGHRAIWRMLLFKLLQVSSYSLLRSSWLFKISRESSQD
jgi:hypothetical protein